MWHFVQWQETHYIFWWVPGVILMGFELAHRLRNTASLVRITCRATLVNPDWAHSLLMATFALDERYHDRIRIKTRVLWCRHWSKQVDESWMKDCAFLTIIYIVMQNCPLWCFVKRLATRHMQQSLGHPSRTRLGRACVVSQVCFNNRPRSTRVHNVHTR